jgi:hypothetical protein
MLYVRSLKPQLKHELAKTGWFSYISGNMKSYENTGVIFPVSNESIVRYFEC